MHPPDSLAKVFNWFFAVRKLLRSGVQASLATGRDKSQYFLTKQISGYWMM
jgi:hypothetical protein